MSAQMLARTGHRGGVKAVFLAGTGVLGAAIAVVASGDSRITRNARQTRPVDPELVAVFPFSVQHSQPALVDLREAIHDMLAARLTGGDGTSRAVEPAAVLAALPRTRSGRDETILAVSAKLGAGLLLRGEVSGTPNELLIRTDLVGVPRGEVRARAHVQGSADSLSYLADRLVVRLLAAQAARDSSELEVLAETPLPALRAYLAGRHAYRRGRAGTPSDAKEHFQRAIFLDSTLALAALRLADIAAMYALAARDERWQYDAIWQQRHRLGPADRAVLDAYIGPRYPRPSTLAELIAAAERATRAAPHRAEAWHIAGVYFLRLGEAIGYPAWRERAKGALLRALAFDSTAGVTLDFLVRLAAKTRDRDAVRRYAGLYLAHNPHGYNADFVRWLAASILGDEPALTATRSRLAKMTSYNLRAIVDKSVALGIGLEDADSAARHYPASLLSPRPAIVTLVPFLLNRGRTDQARHLLATAEDGFGQNADVGILEFRIYAALYWDGDSSDARSAAHSLEAYVGGAPLPFGHVGDRQTARCALAHWWFAMGERERAEVALKRILLRSRSPESYPNESTPMCVAALEAQLAAARGQPDARAALERLDTLLRAGSILRWMHPVVGNVIAARLYEQRGDLRYALHITRRRTSWTNLLLSTQLRDEGRLAALLGDHAAAVRAYRHYLALRSDAEPKLQPEVERVRAELARVDRALTSSP